MITDVIDTTFDFRSDTPPGQDPDACSPTLRRSHQLLWSKPLPNGTSFELDVTTPYAYLHHLSEVGEFFLTSDAVIPTFTRWRIMKHIIEQIPEAENEAFRTLGYTIGGMMVFPGNQVDGKQTINAARGMHPQLPAAPACALEGSGSPGDLEGRVYAQAMGCAVLVVRMNGDRPAVKAKHGVLGSRVFRSVRAGPMSWPVLPGWRCATVNCNPNCNPGSDRCLGHRRPLRAPAAVAARP